MALRKEKIEKSGPGISDVEKPGGSRGKPNPNIRNHWKPSTIAKSQIPNSK
jgi:hypothetical protein